MSHFALHELQFWKYKDHESLSTGDLLENGKIIFVSTKNLIRS